AGPSGKNVSPVSTLLIAMSERTAEPGLAWQLMKKISMDPEVQQAVLENPRAFPCAVRWC
ncbi:MAG: hypothetical protein IJU00_00550, partial [Selenomonas sp.]|nr:hypothetical protein [Selenomonas sp.]